MKTGLSIFKLMPSHKEQSQSTLYNESAEDVVALSGTGMLNLSGDGTSGYLGTAKNRGSFTIGKDLTVTTRGFSIGYIYANLTNEGINISD